MKAFTILSSLAFTFFTFVLNAQTTVLHRFIEETNTSFRVNGVVSIGDYLYGTKYDGGDYGKGYIYKVKKDNSEYEVLLNFDGVNTGTHPVGSFAITGDSLYGITYMGGDNNMSTLYKINMDGTGYQKILDYNDLDGNCCYESPIFQNDTLYGVSHSVIYKININGKGLKRLHTFCGSDVPAPSGPLAIAGKSLYGVTQTGGIDTMGVIYRVDKDGSNYTILHAFTQSEGDRSPKGAVVIIGHSLYGTSLGGAYTLGNLYRIDTDGSDFRVLGDFGSLEGSTPMGLMKKDSILYGVTVNGGYDDYGVIFRSDTTGANYTVLARFDKTNGAYPFSLPSLSDSVFYGYTNAGPFNYGVVYTVITDGSEFKAIRDFTATNDGYDPVGEMVTDSVKWYGLTSGGGKYNCGVIYSINSDGSNYQVVHDFTGIDGLSPSRSLVYSDHILYGMTTMGGNYNYGVAFKYELNGGGLIKLHDFNVETGYHPHGTVLILDNEIYGSLAGGENSRGLIFKMNMDGSAFQPIFQFEGSNAAFPSGTLVNVGSRLFGMAISESSNADLVFSINSDGSDFRILHESTNTIEGGVYGQSIATDGTYLYEITLEGGINVFGLLFKLKTDGSDFQKLLDFDSTTGELPQDPLVVNGSWLFGSTLTGGPGGAGGVFRIRTDGSDFENILSYKTSFGLPSGKKINPVKNELNHHGINGKSSQDYSTKSSIAVFGESVYIVAVMNGIDGNDGRIFKYEFLPTGNKVDKTAAGLEIYPNPATSFLKIKNITRYPSHVCIYNALGAQVMDSEIREDYLDISHLSPGIYMLCIGKENLKFVKR
jgi:uncharacterized repeat protein (TIGR03803 family)